MKQLRYYTRFITVCLLLGKREEVWEHLERLQQLVTDFSQEAQVDFNCLRSGTCLFNKTKHSSIQSCLLGGGATI